MRTAKDEITVGTEHPRSDEWREKGRVRGARLKPDLVWLRRDSGVQWRKVVVDVKVTSTDKMSEAFKEKDEKYRVWTTQETREKKVVMAVMVPLIISHDGAIHKDTIRRWRNFAPDIKIDWGKTCYGTMSSLSGGFSIRELGLRCMEKGARR